MISMKLYYDRRSKNPTYFIQQGIRNGKKTTTRNIKTIGKHNDLLKITDDPLEYAKQEVAKFNEEYKANKISIDVNIDFSKKLPSSTDAVAHSKNVNIGYFFIQSIYHDLKIKDFLDNIISQTRVDYDADLINRFLTISRILDPRSKLGIYDHLHIYYEQPHYLYESSLRFLSLLAKYFDEYISHLYEASNNIIPRDTSVCYFDCTNYYFEIETADEDYVDEVTGEIFYMLRKYGISKQHQPAPIVQMGLFIDAQGIPLSMCINPGNQNEQLCATSTEEKMIRSFKDKKLIYCADAGLGSYDIRKFNSFGSRAFIVTQSIKKLNKDDKKWALDKSGFKRVSDNAPVDLSEIPEDDNGLYYKDEPYTPHSLHQRLIVTYSPKYARYQKSIRTDQVERAKKMLLSGKVKKERRNPNDPARFIGKLAVTKDGETAKIHNYLDTDKIEQESLYDGMYAVTTDLLDDEVKDILKVSEGRWEIEECFRIMKTDFEARPVFLQDEVRIKAHFLICFLSLVIYRYLEKELGYAFTCETILEKLKSMNFADIQEQGFIPLYTRDMLTDALHKVCGFDTDFKFITKSQMKTIQKKSKRRE